MDNQLKLFVLAGPSGCGKTTIAKSILQKFPNTVFSISATTREMRSTETNAKDYYFIKRAEFEEKIKLNELIEWEEIYGDYYGSLKSEVDNAFANGKSIIFDVDVKGALSIKSKYGNNAKLIFIMPPSIEKLIERLRNRKTESEETFRRRMERVKMEMTFAPDFDYRVVNDLLEKAIEEVSGIVQKEIETHNNKNGKS
ncbi:MAG: guanylate kinase [Ignavibacteriales bacterium]|nr:guanylate kinase [Ignavibacteriales bacterium]